MSSRPLLNNDLELEDIGQYINKDTIDEPCDTKGNTPLHIAVKTSNLKLVQYLIAHNARLEPANSDQETPLHLACEQGHLEIVKCLLEKNVGPDGTRRELTEDEKKQLDSLVKVFPEMNAFLNKKPLYSKIPTPLQYAITNKHPDIVEILCLHKADLEAKLHGNTALHLALFLGKHERDGQADRISVKIVTILLKYGAKISAQTDNGVLPRQIAIRTRNIEAIILLLDAFIAQSSPQPRDDAIQKAVFIELSKIAEKERFCDELEQWAQSFRATLHSSESELAESSIVAKAPPFASALSSSSSALSSTLSSSSSLSSSCSMFPPVKSNPKPFTPLGNQFDRHLQEHFQESENAPSDLNSDSDSDYFSNHRYEDLSYTPPEEREPFYVIPSSPEELEADDKEKEEERGSPFRFGFGSGYGSS